MSITAPTGDGRYVFIEMSMATFEMAATAFKAAEQRAIECDAKPHECYKGRRPPLRSVEPAIQNEELWEYAWHSQRYNKRMYLKFAIKKQWYLHVRCHEDRPPETLL